MRKQGKIIKVLWWVYIALLFVVVVVKFKGSFYELSDRVNSYSMQGSINYNLIPFRSMSTQIEYITQWWALKNLFGNIIPFIPFGFLLPIAYKKFNSTIKVLSMGLASILIIEIFQFFTKLGSFDVDDIILNMIGIVCGYLMFLVINRLFVRKR
ncbi:MAG: VanZ family protein [Lachnospiraceae bacterium]|nr:VanZ family protein [Lachnospiraceae bacterium]